MFVVLLSLLASAAAFCLDPSTAANFNVKLMLGGWHQVYTNELTYAWLEENTVCIQAHYGVNSNGTVSVNNTALVGGVQSSQVYQILGWAAASKPQYPAELTVSLQGVPLPAPLWWLATSSNATGRYEWAVGSDPLCATLFVITRDYPIPKPYLPQIDAALATHSWKRKDLVEITWAGCSFP